MCLDVLNNTETRKAKKQTKPIVAYKIVGIQPVGETKRKYISPFGPAELCVFKKGLNIDKGGKKRLMSHYSCKSYKSGFHCFLKAEDAIKISKRDYNYRISNKKFRRVIRVYIDPEHVIAVGTQFEYDSIVASAFTIRSFNPVEK